MKLRQPGHTSDLHTSQSQPTLWSHYCDTSSSPCPIPSSYWPVDGCPTATDVSSHRGKVKAFLRIVRTVEFLWLNNSGCFIPTDFCRTPGQRSLKPINPGRMSSYMQLIWKVSKQQAIYYPTSVRVVPFAWFYARNCDWLYGRRRLYTTLMWASILTWTKAMSGLTIFRWNSKGISDRKMGTESEQPSATALRTFAAMKKEHDLKIPAKLKLGLLNAKSEAVILVIMNNTVYWDGMKHSVAGIYWCFRETFLQDRRIIKQ